MFEWKKGFWSKKEYFLWFSLIPPPIGWTTEVFCWLETFAFEPGLTFVSKGQLQKRRNKLQFWNYKSSIICSLFDKYLGVMVPGKFLFWEKELCLPGLLCSLRLHYESIWAVLSRLIYIFSKCCLKWYQTSPLRKLNGLGGKLAKLWLFNTSFIHLAVPKIASPWMSQCNFYFRRPRSFSGVIDHALRGNQILRLSRT